MDEFSGVAAVGVSSFACSFRAVFGANREK
jgi:hypothetical protein